MIYTIMAITNSMVLSLMYVYMYNIPSWSRVNISRDAVTYILYDDINNNNNNIYSMATVTLLHISQQLSTE